ncbi:DUF4158 domain-containing protein [Streptomyces sp. NPDC003016]
MRQDWEPEDLIEVWTLHEDDKKRVRNTSGTARLGFALLLEFSEVEARFPESAKEVPAAALEYVAQQVEVPAAAWPDYDWQSKAIRRHRGEIRAAYGFRANAEEDQDRVAGWPATELCPVELSRDRPAASVVARCRDEHIEPPAPGQVRRLVGKAVKDFEERFCRSTLDRLSHATRSRLEDLVAGEGADGDGAAAGSGRSHFTELKADPGAPGLESLLTEVNKLGRVRRLELPADLFADVSEKLVDTWRARVEGVAGEPGAHETASAADPAGRCAMSGRRRVAVPADERRGQPHEGTALRFGEGARSTGADVVEVQVGRIVVVGGAQLRERLDGVVEEEARRGDGIGRPVAIRDGQRGGAGHQLRAGGVDPVGHERVFGLGTRCPRAASSRMSARQGRTWLTMGTPTTDMGAATEHGRSLVSGAGRLRAVGRGRGVRAGRSARRPPPDRRRSPT